MQKINPNDSVYTICKTHPETKNILAELGFDLILKKNMLETVGKFMTLKKGANRKNIPLKTIQEAFKKQGYQLEE